MAEISNPHDRLFKETFSRPDVAADLMRNTLPADMVAQLDLARLELRKDSFVDPELQNHFSDLVYAVQMTGEPSAPAFVYVLFEHKSYPEPRVALQLLRYLVRIWDQSVRERPNEPLPAILPVVVYHGDGAWNISRSFTALLSLRPEFLSHTPAFEYSLCDLTAWSDAEITRLRGAVFMRVTFLLLNNHDNPDLPWQLPSYLALLSGLTRERSAVEYLYTALRYLYVASPLSREDLRSAVIKALPVEGETIMRNAAQEWLEEGIEQGIKQGIEQGELRNLRDNIRQGLEIKFGEAGLRLMDRLGLDRSNDARLLRDFLAALFRHSTIAELEAAYRKISAHRAENGDTLS